jgi:hypothetical protein
VNRETAERCTILRGLVGSTVHGLNVNDGIEDRDEMGICVEPLEDAMALWAPFEQFIYRSAAEREGRDDARSSAGDLDLTIYSLRKWTRLALKGNPTIMLCCSRQRTNWCFATSWAPSCARLRRQLCRAASKGRSLGTSKPRSSA